VVETPDVAYRLLALRNELLDARYSFREAKLPACAAYKSFASRELANHFYGLVRHAPSSTAGHYELFKELKHFFVVQGSLTSSLRL
jgi:hypothetical protein